MTSLPSADASLSGGDFRELFLLVKERGLFDRQPLYYVYKSILNMSLLGAGIAVLFLTDNVWIQLLNAAYLALIFGQIGLLFHDAGHRQIFTRSRRDDVIGQVCAFVLQTSFCAWMDIHNRHHAHPNREDEDPDISLPFFAYSEAQAHEAHHRSLMMRTIIRHQGFLYFPLLSFTAFSMRATGWRFLRRNKDKVGTYLLDWMCVLLGPVVYLIVVFAALPPLTGVVFVVAHQLLWGFYIGSIFAPNHKGMPVIGKDEKIDYVREQVMTARNVRSNAIINFVYGGLNFQVEHHLFPTMPRNNLPAASKIVKEFCSARNIPYYETGIVRSYYEIVSNMHSIARTFRSLQAAA